MSYHKDKNEYVPFPVKVLSKKDESADTFTLRLDWKVKHDPGQFIQISIPGIGEAPISISSYSDKYMEITIRKVGNVTNGLYALKEGDTVLVRGPYGKGYPMDELKGNNIIFIGGGCGVAPLKGAIEYVEKNRKDEFTLNVIKESTRYAWSQMTASINEVYNNCTVNDSQK